MGGSQSRSIPATPTRSLNSSRWPPLLPAFVGSFAILLIVANLRHGTVWVPYTVILAALVAGHLCLRALLYKRRRRARQRNVPAHKDSSARSVP